MKVTTSILIALIQEYALAKQIYVAHESNFEIRSIRLFNKAIDDHTLYICTNISDIQIDRENAAFVLVSASYQALPTSSADLFELVTDQKPLDVLYQLYDLLLRIQKWDRDLEENALSSYHFFQLFHIGREIYPYPFCLIDHEFKIIGMTQDMYPFSPTGETPQNNKISDDRASELLSDPQFQTTSTLTGIYTYPSHQKDVTRLCININENGNYLGRILSDVHNDTPGIRALFKHLGDTLTKAFLSYTDDVMVSRENDKLHQLLADLLSGKKDCDDASLILERYHWPEDGLYRMAAISLSNQRSIRTIRPYLSYLLERKFASSCVLAEEDMIILISALSDTDEAYAKKLLETTSTWSLTIGISSPIYLNNLKTGYHQAVFALQQEASEKAGCRFFNTCYIEYFMAVLKRDMPNEDFCHPGLKKLIEKDQKEKTDDTKLVWELICSGFNVSKAAENSYVHRSTFIRRLHIISQITGINFSHPLDPDTLFDLLLSFRILSYRTKGDRLPDSD